MTGAEYYALYRQALLEVNNCESDEWSDLEGDEQAAWDRFAQLAEGAKA